MCYPTLTQQLTVLIYLLHKVIPDDGPRGSKHVANNSCSRFYWVFTSSHFTQTQRDVYVKGDTTTFLPHVRLAALSVQTPREARARLLWSMTSKIKGPDRIPATEEVWPNRQVTISCSLRQKLHATQDLQRCGSTLRYTDVAFEYAQKCWLVLGLAFYLYFS
jgi:hypothetical protein